MKIEKREDGWYVVGDGVDQGPFDTEQEARDWAERNVPSPHQRNRP